MYVYIYLYNYDIFYIGLIIIVYTVEGIDPGDVIKVVGGHSEILFFADSGIQICSVEDCFYLSVGLVFVLH